MFVFGPWIGEKPSRDEYVVAQLQRQLRCATTMADESAREFWSDQDWCRVDRLLASHLLSGGRGLPAVESLVGTLAAEICEQKFVRGDLPRRGRIAEYGVTTTQYRPIAEVSSRLGDSRLAHDMCLGAACAGTTPLVVVEMRVNRDFADALIGNVWTLGALMLAMDSVLPVWTLWQIRLSVMLNEGQFTIGGAPPAAARLGIGTVLQA